MTRKINLQELLTLIKEAEEESQEVSSLEDSKNATRLSKDSVDDQIDSMIIKFESEAMSDPDLDALKESLSTFKMGSILLEQDAEADAAADADADADNEESPEEETPELEPPPESNVPPIDMDSFTKRVARLAMSHEVLLDVKTVVINRAIEFLSENYTQEQIEEFKEILDEQFDFNLEGTPEIPEAPIAVGAGGPGGGLGGGGG